MFLSFTELSRVASAFLMLIAIVFPLGFGEGAEK